MEKIVYFIVKDIYYKLDDESSYSILFATCNQSVAEGLMNRLEASEVDSNYRVVYRLESIELL